MKILVFSSCSKSKAIKYPHQPTCDEITSKEMKERFLQMSPDKRTAKELYRGALNLSITNAVKQLREFFEVSHYIVSAGFGILEENELVPPYDCSFSEMNKTQIKERAHLLKIPNDYDEIIKRKIPI